MLNNELLIKAKELYDIMYHQESIETRWFNGYIDSDYDSDSE